jgi:hypothetical protein
MWEVAYRRHDGSFCALFRCIHFSTQWIFPCALSILNCDLQCHYNAADISNRTDKPVISNATVCSKWHYFIHRILDAIVLCNGYDNLWTFCIKTYHFYSIQISWNPMLPWTLFSSSQICIFVLVFITPRRLKHSFHSSPIKVYYYFR